MMTVSIANSCDRLLLIFRVAALSVACVDMVALYTNKVICCQMFESAPKLFPGIIHQQNVQRLLKDYLLAFGKSVSR